ncbi:MAG TPA: shikimate dehydrogenase [Paenibacillus sp.]|nr:shikimate dehydrogenase [Paenibacillus sp.]
MRLPEPADRPTMYFIGVTTGQSSIMKLFPLWAEALGLKDAVIKGIDIEIHADPAKYIECVEFIKNDPLSLGALVTTHKIDLFHAARHAFDAFDAYAEAFEEVSSISKRDGRLIGHAKDPITSGLAMEAFIPKGHWAGGGEAFLMGAGGSALAISSWLTDAARGDDIPSKIILSNRSEPRLRSAETLLGRIDTPTTFEYVLCPEPTDNDAVLERLAPGALVVNATGLGKDRPGSPLTDDAAFPEGALVWELNYRGELDFLHQANRQKAARGLRVEDGWIYFLHGWTQVIAEVFDLEMTPDRFAACERIAAETRK